MGEVCFVLERKARSLDGGCDGKMLTSMYKFFCVQGLQRRALVVLGSNIFSFSIFQSFRDETVGQLHIGKSISTRVSFSSIGKNVFPRSPPTAGGTRTSRSLCRRVRTGRHPVPLAGRAPPRRARTTRPTSRPPMRWWTFGQEVGDAEKPLRIHTHTEFSFLYPCCLLVCE